jgi:hypothetical protein
MSGEDVKRAISHYDKNGLAEKAKKLVDAQISGLNTMGRFSRIIKSMYINIEEKLAFLAKEAKQERIKKLAILADELRIIEKEKLERINEEAAATYDRNIFTINKEIYTIFKAKCIEESHTIKESIVKDEKRIAYVESAKEARVARAAKIAEEAKKIEALRRAGEGRITGGAKHMELLQFKKNELIRRAEAVQLAEKARLAEIARFEETLRVAEGARIAEKARFAEEAQLGEKARLAEENRLAEEANLVQAVKAAEEANLVQAVKAAEEANLVQAVKAAEEARIMGVATLIKEERLRKEKANIYDAIVLCGGKCGGTALSLALKESGYSTAHFHSHIHRGMVKSNIEITPTFTLYNAINNIPTSHLIYIIDSYRTPIERKISAFFQNISITIPDYKTLSVEDLIVIFNQKYLSEIEEYHPMDAIMTHYNVPIFKEFDFAKSYNIARNDNLVFIKILFKDIKKWDAILAGIMDKPIVLQEKNINNNPLYKAFLKIYRVDRSYLQTTLQQDTTFTIYNTKEEQKEYIDRWMDRSYITFVS